MTNDAAARQRRVPDLTPGTVEPDLRRRQETRHGPVAQLLIAWSPLSAVLAFYWLAQWLGAPLGASSTAPSTNRVGARLHTLAPARVDTDLFGAVPSVWLQHHLAAGAPHWYDVVAALVYASHFVVIPLLTAIVWFRQRHRFWVWMAATLTMSALGCAIYVAYPAAPPWLTASHGGIGTVARLSDLGWTALHLQPLGRLTELAQSGSNPVAAMPSLHAATSLLVVLFLWRSVGLVSRAMLSAYALAMAVTLVYTGEHYVVDVLAGWCVAGLGAATGELLLWASLRREHGCSRAPRRVRPSSRHASS